MSAIPEGNCDCCKNPFTSEPSRLSIQTPDHPEVVGLFCSACAKEFTVEAVKLESAMRSAGLLT